MGVLPWGLCVPGRYCCVFCWCPEEDNVKGHATPQPAQKTRQTVPVSTENSQEPGNAIVCRPVWWQGNKKKERERKEEKRERKRKRETFFFFCLSLPHKQQGATILTETRRQHRSTGMVMVGAAPQRYVPGPVWLTHPGCNGGRRRLLTGPQRAGLAVLRQKDTTGHLCACNDEPDDDMGVLLLLLDGATQAMAASTR